MPEPIKNESVTESTTKDALDTSCFSADPREALVLTMPPDTVNEYLKELDLAEKEQAAMAECVFEAFNNGQSKTLERTVPFYDTPLSSPDISEDARVAMLALCRVIKFEPERGLSMLVELLQNGTLEVEKDDSSYKFLRVQQSCYEDSGNSIKINLSKLVEDYQNSPQKIIDRYVNTIRGKWKDSPDCEKFLSIIHRATVSGLFSTEKYLEIVREASKASSAKDAVETFIVAYFGKKGSHLSAKDAIQHAIFALPFDSTIRISRELAKIETTQYEDNIALSKYLTLMLMYGKEASNRKQ